MVLSFFLLISCGIEVLPQKSDKFLLRYTNSLWQQQHLHIISQRTQEHSVSELDEWTWRLEVV